MLEISPLQPIDLNNKMVYIYELKNGGNFQYIYLKLEYVHKLGRLQSSLNIFKDCSVFNFSVFYYICFMRRLKTLTVTERLPAASKATDILI